MSLALAQKMLISDVHAYHMP